LRACDGSHSNNHEERATHLHGLVLVIIRAGWQRRWVWLGLCA
jgi:hypothetical protein